MSGLTEQEKIDYQTLGRFLGLAEFANLRSDEEVVKAMRQIAAEYNEREAQRKAATA